MERTQLSGRVRATQLVALGAAVAVALATLSVTPAAADDHEQTPQPSHVIFFDFDGFDHRFIDGEYADAAELPNIRGLVDSGAYGVASGSFKSVSNTSRATTATGTYPDVHNNVAGYYDLDNDVHVGQERFIEPDVETIAHALSRQDRTAAYLQWYIVENYGAQYGDPDSLYTQPGGTCDARADQAVDIVNGDPVDSDGEPVQLDGIPDLITVYCDDVDALLHSEGFSSPNLEETLDRVDEQVGRVVQATQDAGIYNETTFVFTSDHGMRTWTDGILPEFLEALESTGFQAERVSTNQSADPSTEIILTENVRTAQLTLRGDALDELEAIAQAAEGVEGVDEVFRPEQLDELRAGEKAHHIVATADEPHHFSSNLDGVDRATHAALDEAEMPLILAGYGVQPGAVLDDPALIDVTPTITTLLGVDAPSHAEGRFLAEAFADDTGPDPDDATVQRFSGAGRVETAIDISQDQFEDGAASTVVLARADDYADALAGTPLAVRDDGPLLVTNSDLLVPTVVDEIQRVLPDDGTVTLLGGEAALDAGVEAAVADLGYDVERLAGPTRFETAVAVATSLDGGAAALDSVLITTAFDFPDALIAGAAASAHNGAVVLTGTDGPHPAVDAFLAGRDAEVFGIGGPAARAYPDAEAVAGETRDHTAVLVAERFFDEPVSIGLARPDSFADALAGGAHVGREGGPLLLSLTRDELSDLVVGYIDAHGAAVTDGSVYGGTEAISDGVLTFLAELLDAEVVDGD